VRFKSLVDTKSTSRIRINKDIKKEPTHLEVIEFLKNNYYDHVIDIVKTISYNINKNSIDNILDSYNGIMSEKRIALIKRFLIEKVKLILEQFNIRKEE